MKSVITFLSICFILISSSIASAQTNWFGGDVYDGAPALPVTAALVKAGGGADNFNFATALVSMLGEDTVNAEVAKLTKQYGQENVNSFIKGMTFAVNSAIKHATKAGVVLPKAPKKLQGVELAKTLVEAGTDANGVWWSGQLFDKALSNKIHVAVMVDIDSTLGHEADRMTHRILNQAMYDVAQALGYKNVKLASLH